MNGPEFFMQHAGYRLLPPPLKTGDAVADADTLFSTALLLHTGAKKRLSQCWMVVTPDWTATSFKTLPEAGFRHDMERQAAIRDALTSGQPWVNLLLGLRKMTASDLFVTYDPLAVRRCSEDKVKTIDSTKGKC